MQADHRLSSETDNWVMEFIVYGNETTDTPDDDTTLGLFSVIFEQDSTKTKANDFVTSLQLDAIRELADDTNKDVEQTLTQVTLYTDLVSEIEGTNAYSYFGKVTTPPCDNAYWWIMETTVKISDDDSAKILNTVDKENYQESYD